MKERSARPRTLTEVAARRLAGQPFDPLVCEFLDEFYSANDENRQRAIQEEPARIAPVHDAYLAAVAEHLALQYRLFVPEWTYHSVRILDRPFFAGGLEGLKTLLFVESPLAFRRRQIFVSANALSRPRQLAERDAAQEVNPSPATPRAR